MAFSSETITVFLAVLDHGSFSAAARALNRVPSAISMSIANLEAELDLNLFDRSSREPMPTEAALALAPKAREIISHLQGLNNYALGLHQGLENALTIVIAPELLSIDWSSPLVALEHSYPMLKINIITAPQEDALELLHQGQAQLAIVFERPKMDERELFKEFSQELLIAVIAPTHAFFTTHKENLLDQEALINIRQIALTSRFAHDVDRRLLLSRMNWHTDSYLATLSLVKSGLGWAFLPKSLVAAAIDSGSLLEINFSNMSNQISLWVDVVWSKKQPLGLGAKRYIDLISSRPVT